MRFATVMFALAILASVATAQTASNIEPKFVTVPITLDHNRVIIDVYLPLPDGSTKRVRGWVDTGDPDLHVSQRIAKLMGLTVSCDGQACAAQTPREFTIGGMKIPLAAVKEAKVPLKPENANSVMVAGTSAEIKIPSTVLCNYDVLINFPDREFSIGLPGTLNFKGVKSKMIVNTSTGFIQVPSRIENKSYNLGLDVGSPISFLSTELFNKLAAAHAAWPHMTGAVGPANVGEAGDDEQNWKLMRVERVQYGPLYLTDVAVAELPKSYSDFFEKDAGASVAGLLGSSALMNYRVGLDYTHSMAYFDIGSTFKFPDFDVVGLVLRPEDDTRFTIVGVADIDGKPSVPEVQAGDHLAAVDDIPVPDSTLGEVWSMLEGSPGQERKLVIERAGKQFTVLAKVQHFLGESDENSSNTKAGKKK
ncbi:MAG: hypothetical protein ABSC33_15190 [Candidatus Sulfotelmatobacter sp.]